LSREVSGALGDPDHRNTHQLASRVQSGVPEAIDDDRAEMFSLSCPYLGEDVG
jgi:hypothetical protein